VRKQRIAQKIRSADLCVRLGITHPTLSRLERGEPTIGAGTYLDALHVLGVFNLAAPSLALELWQMEHPAGRARPRNKDNDGYF
jgi:transcriptional regulator with XRE-family HTH domain